MFFDKEVLKFYCLNQVKAMNIAITYVQEYQQRRVLSLNALKLLIEF